jgi:hypothetical protein
VCRNQARARETVHQRAQTNRCGVERPADGAWAPITTPQGGSFKSLNVTTRKALGLYANVRPCVVAALAAHSSPVWLETDMRAHRSPTRMAQISEAAKSLAERLASVCPACTAPGFGRANTIPGARCEDCGTPTEAACAEQLACAVCSHAVQRQLAETVSAARCPVCNP